MKLKLALISVFLVGLVLGAVVMGAAVSLVQIQNIGTIRSIGVEVYADAGLSQILSQIARAKQYERFIVGFIVTGF